jgi:hypothetical protein
MVALRLRLQNATGGVLKMVPLPTLAQAVPEKERRS